MNKFYLSFFFAFTFWQLQAQTPLDYQPKAPNLPALTDNATAQVITNTFTSYRGDIPQELADTLQGVLEKRWEWLGSVGLSAALRDREIISYIE